MSIKDRSTLKSEIDSEIINKDFTTGQDAGDRLKDIVDSFAPLSESGNWTKEQEFPSATFKDKPFVDPTHKDFGAVADGSTDDSQALEDTFTYAANNKLAVKIPPGDFYTSDPIDLNVNDLVVFGSGRSTRIIADQPSGQEIIRNRGTSGSPLKNTTLGNFHIERLNGDSSNNQDIHLAHINNVLCYNITAEGLASAIVRGDFIRYGQFYNFIGKNLGISQACISLFDCDNIQIDSSIHYGSVETGESVDLSSCEKVQIGLVYSENNTGEVLDIGSCSNVHVDSVIGLNCDSALTVKSEGGSGSKSDNISVNSVLGVDISESIVTISGATQNDDPDAKLEDISIGEIKGNSNGNGVNALKVITSSEATETIIPKDITVGNINASVTSGTKGNEYPIYISNAENVKIESGKVIDTFGERSIIRSENVDGLILEEELTLKYSGTPNGSFPTLSIFETNRLTIYCSIIGGESDGIKYELDGLPDSKLICTISPKIVRNVGLHGLYIQLPLDTGWNGKTIFNISNGTYLNWGKNADQQHSIKIEERHGGTVTGVKMDNNLSHITRSSPSSRGTFYKGNFDYCTRRDNDYYKINFAEKGSVGSNGVKRTGVVESP
jgi:hypothetical protein